MTSSFDPNDRKAQNTQQMQAEKMYASVFNRRCVALVLDVAAAYFIGIMLSFLVSIICALFPIVSKAISLSIIMVIYLLVRDYLFSGRGIGKNLVGLQVVDSRFMRPAQLKQSVIRNMSWLLPFVVLSITQMLALIIPWVWINQVISEAVHILGAVYCMVMFPMEAYKAYYRADGLRLGDELAGTRVVEAHMDFSRAIPKE
jgi:uncharacterized RDD family membrane protein YckC